MGESGINSTSGGIYTPLSLSRGKRGKFMRSDAIEEKTLGSSRAVAPGFSVK